MTSKEIEFLKEQDEVVIEVLMEEDKLTRKQAFDTWFTSKTKDKIKEMKLFYVSGMRCYWELKLELSNDRRWFNEPFDL